MNELKILLKMINKMSELMSMDMISAGRKGVNAKARVENVNDHENLKIIESY